jgi:tetratricopeptide (TPR) repeat protein
VDRKELEAGLDDIQRAMRMVRSNAAANAAFIDTRGYLYHLLGEQQKALDDLDKAISLTTAERSHLRLPEMQEKLNEDLAVMHHHRSLVHQALGNIEEAESDRELANELGYDPDAGVL